MANRRIDQLDGVRALAVSAVVIHHVFHVRLLWMGVDLFFILSGFLITGVLLERRGYSLKEYLGYFYRRRARRILPPYILLLLATTVFFGVVWARHWYCYFFFMNFVPALGLSQPHSLSVLWSLGVEEQFYFAWPFAVFFLGERALAWFAAGLVLAAPLLRWFCTPLFSNHWAIYVLTPFRMDLLAAGALLAILWRRRPELIKQHGQYGPVFSLLALGLLWILARDPRFTTSSNTPESNLLIYEMTLVIAAGVMLWALSGKGTGILTLAPARYLGRISYTVYLIHLTVYAVASSYLHGRIEVLSATFAVTLLYAGVSWHVLESPILAPRSNRAPVPSPNFSKLPDSHRRVPPPKPTTFVGLPNHVTGGTLPSTSKGAPWSTYD